MTAPHYADELVKLYQGEALAVLAELETASVDAVITDPPYSSGGQVRGDRMMTARTKYVTSSAQHTLETFGGDNRDQRSYQYWCALWLAECLRVTKPGGILAMFTDWRQLPATTDAVQAGGWVWRGILPWIKPDARPQKGRFSAAAEYVVWATNGPREMNFQSDDPTPAGYYLCIAPRDREHITQKPLEVMLHLTALVEPGGLVLDPFMGAGTTGVAAVMRGARFIGADHHAHNVEISERRIRAATLTAAPKGDQTAIDFGALS